MVEALKGKPGLMKQLKSIFDDLHGSREFSVYPDCPDFLPAQKPRIGKISTK